MRKRDINSLVKYQINNINKYLAKSDQRLELSEEKKTDSEEVYWDLTWIRPVDQHTEIEEHVFGGDMHELFVSLNGIEYGIRMQKNTI